MAGAEKEKRLIFNSNNMTKKYYFLYGGLLFTDLVSFVWFAVLIPLLFEYYGLHLPYLPAFIVSLAVILLLASKRLTYHLKVVDSKSIIEGGFFSKGRSINISDIRSIKHNDFVPYRYDLRYTFVPMPMINFEMSPGSLNEVFPKYPISPRVLYSIIAINPDVSIDPALKDILPGEIRKKYGIKLNIVDAIGLWIWRVLLTILLSVVAIIVLFFLWGLLHYIGLIEI